MKIGFIGCGNLGSSMIRGLLDARVARAEDLIAMDVDAGKLEGLRKLGVKATTDYGDILGADVILIAVKPDLVARILDELNLSEDKLLISVAAGVSIETLERHTRARVVRVMPNICCRVAEMASAFALGNRVKPEDEEVVRRLLGSLGLALKVDEGTMNAVTGLSGSGPAYIFLLIQSLMEAGIELGLSKEEAFKLAAQTVKGSGEMALRSGADLKELIDMVSSPKGTTVEGMKVLRDSGVPEAFKKAVKAAARRAEELSR
ncbi:MAG: pyrroline-5-carboxylate reductase [Hadesarchaea archaeon]|nr:pyrroline-5-carboxylate reductase [Hadesarchaea archaeon]